MDGSQTFLIEIQALCLSGSTGSRQVHGIQLKRADMIISVLIGFVFLIQSISCCIEMNAVKLFLTICLSLELQVLIKQAGLPLQEHAVFFNFVSGLALAETAGDLAIAAAICSCCLEIPILNDIAFIGEIDLGGELRMVPRMEKRVYTVTKLGFRMCIVPKVAEKALGTEGFEKMEVVGCRNLKDIINTVFPNLMRRSQ
ncbi:hypothetical protein JHK82_017250 [Glycine max]|nr:hypothetical protein JHK86_017302 [Glycine max]KAG5141555.1 hypothetical protein JHK82_017250 [Glycine max]